MSANLYERDCQTGIEDAWHHQTVIVKSIHRDGGNSGICYDMGIVPLYIKGKDEEFIETGMKQIVSFDDGLPVGNPVTDAYSLIDNRQIFSMLDESLTGTKNEIVSCGTIENRSKGFITIKLSDAITAAGRETKPFLNILWGHGGNLKVIADTSFIVTVCGNTFRMNLNAVSSNRLTVKHTKNSVLKLANMGREIELSDSS